MIHKGQCHCGEVTYEVDAAADLEVSECNCSICSKLGYLHLIVPAANFRLLSGENNLTTYTFDSGEAKHKFCKTCGIKSFYIPRSHPEGISVNMRCLDESSIKSYSVTQFDGKNWQ